MNLALLQLGDSALPIGGYSHSWGLEAAIANGLVSDAATLESWARRWLRYSAAPSEGVVVAAACRAATEGDWPQVRYANELLAAGLTPPTLRAASCNMGEHLLALAEAWPWAAETAAAIRRITAEEPWHHAPVFGALAAAGGVSCEDAMLIYLHQAALGVVGAGVKAVPIGHSHGQQILARLHDELYGLAGEMADRPLEDAGAFCPAYEVLCHEQSRLYTRLFRS
jgi:urease accessory protein